MRFIGIIILSVFIFGCVSFPEEYKSAKDFHARKDYAQAISEYEKALEKTKGKKEKEQILQDIFFARRAFADEKVQKIDRIVLQQSTPILETYDFLLEEINSGMSFDDDRGLLEKKQKELVSKRSNLVKEINAFVQKASSAQEEGDLKKAIDALESALGLNPTNQNYVTEKQRLEDTHIARCNLLAKEALAAILAQQMEMAAQRMESLMEFCPGDERIADIQEKLNEASLNLLKNRISVLEEQRKYYMAWMLSQRNQTHLQDIEVSLAQKGAQHYLEKAIQHLQADQLSLAYGAALKAIRMAPQDIRVFQVHKKCQDLLEKRLHIRIALRRFGSPANLFNEGPVFSSALTSRLFSSLPFGVSISEDPDAPDVHWIITGEISDFPIDRQVKEYPVLVDVVTGSREIMNPVYNEMLQQYGKNTKKWPQQVPLMVTQNTIRTVQAKKGSVTIHAVCNVSVRVVESGTGAIRYSENFVESVEYFDEYEEPLPEAGIVGKALSLPSEVQIRHEVRNKALNSVEAFLLGILSKRDEAFLEKAQRSMERREYEVAIEHLALGQFYCEMNQRQNEVAQRINNLFITMTEEF